MRLPYMIRAASCIGRPGITMGRTILAALIVIGSLWPSLSQAQGSPSPGQGSRGTPGAPRGGSVGATIRHDAPPPPSPPSAPAAGPLVPQAPPSALNTPDIFRANPQTYAPRFDRSSRRNRFYGSGSYGYITDPFGYISQPDSSSPRLDRYMSQGIQGYPRDLDISTSRDANDALASVTQRSRTAGPPKTFYVIPRCYAGDVRPTAQELPPGCDIAQLREVPPVIAPVR